MPEELQNMIRAGDVSVESVLIYPSTNANPFDLTFVWNSFWENDIKRADSVGYYGNHEVRADGIHVPDFAMIGRSLTREVELRMFES